MGLPCLNSSLVSYMYELCFLTMSVCFPIQGRSELASKGINSDVPAGQSQKRSELVPTGINYEVPEKAKRNPLEGISGNFQSQGKSELAPKGSNSEVPVGQFQQRSKLETKLIHSTPTEFEIQIWVFNFGHGVEYSKI